MLFLIGLSFLFINGHACFNGRIVICLRLLIRNFRFLMFILRLLPILLSMTNDNFSGRTFNCRITIVIYMLNDISKSRRIKRSASASMGNASRALNLYFRKINGVSAIHVGRFSVVRTICRFLIVLVLAILTN